MLSLSRIELEANCTLNHQVEQAPVAFITGAAVRIGAAVTEQLHADGMNVVIHYRQSQTQAHALRDELNQQRDNSAICVQGDLQDLPAMKTAIEHAANHWGRLDAVVNNASLFFSNDVNDLMPEQWHDLMNTNVMAPYFLAQYAQPYLEKTQGCIVNVSDIHAQRPLQNYSAYCISKAGIEMLTKSLAKDLAPTIRVNAVAPGAILWPEGNSELDQAERERITDKLPLKRKGDPSQIAKTISHLIKDAAYVTGQIWNVDGGRTLCT